MKTYYHVTDKKNWPFIQVEGLIPIVGERSAELYESPCIFLFPTQEDMDTALLQWLGEWYDDKEIETDERIDLISLKITLPDNFPIIPGDVEYECISTAPIGPEFIHFYKDE